MFYVTFYTIRKVPVKIFGGKDIRSISNPPISTKHLNDTMKIVLYFDGGSLNVKGDINKLTLIVKVGYIGTVIRPLNEEESRQFRKKITHLI